jgi:chlorite dismutase
VAYWRIGLLALKMRRGWARIPPEQRRKIMKTAGKQARKHGPTVAKNLREAVKKVRKAR